MITVNTHEAKTKLSALLAEVEQHKAMVVICRAGKPIAKLSAFDGTAIDPLIQHRELVGQLLYDPTEGASEEEWPEEAR